MAIPVRGPSYSPSDRLWMRVSRLKPVRFALHEQVKARALEGAELLFDCRQVLGLASVEVNRNITLQLRELMVQRGGGHMSRRVCKVLEFVWKRRFGDDGSQVLDLVDELPKPLRRARVGREGDGPFLI